MVEHISRNLTKITSKSRLAVDREFMYIGSAGPGRADGRKARRADGRTGGRTEGGRADGRAEGRTDGGRTGGRTGATVQRWSSIFNDFERQCNDFHRCWTILNDSTTIFIDFKRFWTTVQRFSSISNDFERQYNDFHRFWTILNDSTTIFINFRKKHDFERQYNDFHRFSQKQSKTIVFFCRFASGGAARIDFYCKTEKCIKKTYKIDSVFWLFKSPESASTDFYT